MLSIIEDKIAANHSNLLCIALCAQTVTSRAIIFFQHKKDAHRAKILFSLCNWKASELHGNLTQNQRLDALEKFRDGQVDFLLATDLAARGLDIIGIETIVNLSMPSSLTDYVHRVGRTARAGHSGRSISFCGVSDRKLLKRIVKLSSSKVKQRILPSAEVKKWKETINELEKDILSILQEEREERQIRIAEMEAQKAQNLMDHEEEIYSRPKKTWFQSEKQKHILKERSKRLVLESSNSKIFPKKDTEEEDSDEESNPSQERNKKRISKKSIHSDAKKTEALPKRKHFKSRKQRRRALMESGMDGVRAKFIATASKKRLRMEKERSQKKGSKRRKKSKAWW